MRAMIEYRIHGRGGQGNVAAAYLLASAAFSAGWFCQAFPAFGAERRGAPVAAFVRIDRQPIRLRAQVRAPDYLIVQDDTLLIDPKITSGLKPDGAMLVNSKHDSDEIAAHFSCSAFSFDATAMAMAETGRPIPNTALLAALLALTGQFSIDALATALEGRFHGDILAKNLSLIRKAAAIAPAGLWEKDFIDA